MPIVGTVESLWRYPVKSMRGEELNEMFAGYAGVYGDRLFAFTSSASPEGFPFFTGREQRQMLRRSEEHTSELQSQFHLVCRLLLEKKKKSICSDEKDR